MQLDPQKPFSSQIKNLKGQDFEHIVAACYLYLGYFVERNVHYGIDKQQIGELDLVGFKITPLHEIQVVVECKGRHPSPTDLRTFASYKQIMKNDYSLVDLIAYGSDAVNDFHYKIASKLDVKLIKKSDLSKKVLPIVWKSGELVQNRITEINKILLVFDVIDKHKEIRSDATGDLRKEVNGYFKYLETDLWSISNPIEQLENSFSYAKDEFYNFSSKIADIQGKRISTEVRRPSDKFVQLAIYLELKHRILNVLAISRATIVARTDLGRNAITERTPSIRDALNSLCDYNIEPNKFLIFIFRWIFLWGGAFKKENSSIDKELGLLCDEVGISLQNGRDFLEIFRAIYSAGASLFFENSEIIFFKYVPASFRAIGLKYREILGFDYKRLFSDDNYNRKMFEQIMGTNIDDYSFQFKV